MIDNWVQRKLPNRFERRIDFENYELTREFLDLAADISAKEGFYPDINFGKHHVSMTIHVDEKEGGLEEEQLRFAMQVNAIAPLDKVAKPLKAEYEVEEG